jgi:hypothetical protein
MRRHRLRRRLIWVGVWFGLALLFVAVSVLRLYVCARDVVVARAPPPGLRPWA